MRLGPRTFSILCAVIAVALAAVAPAMAGARTGTLEVTVAGLPKTTPGKVTVTGKGVRRTFGRTKRLKLKPGRYTVKLRTVKLRKRAAGVPRRSAVLPKKKRLKVRVKAAKTRRVTAAYGTVRNAHIRRGRLTILAAGPDASAPTSLTVPKAKHPKVGQILASGPTAKVPAGLLHKVTKVKLSGARAILTVKPIHLSEAFPQLSVNKKVVLDDLPSYGKRQGPTFEYDLSSYFNCGGPVFPDSPISVRPRVGVSAAISVDIPLKWGFIPVGLPYGKIAATLSGGLGATLKLPGNIGCQAAYEFFRKPFTIIIGGVPVPAFVAAEANADLKSASDGLGINGDAGFAATGGVAFKGTDLDNISSLDGSADLTGVGGGTSKGEIEIKLGVGVQVLKQDFDIYVSGGPTITGAYNLDGSCSIGVGAAFNVGVDFTKLHFDQELANPTHTIHTCPARPPGLPPADERAVLDLGYSAPLGAFPNQKFTFAAKVDNNGTRDAHDVVVKAKMPDAGSFVSASAPSTPADPQPGDTVTFKLGDIEKLQVGRVDIRWRAPGEAATLTSTATASAADAEATAERSASVPVGTSTRCNPCGAQAAGTGLRNRDHGSVAIGGIPEGATVGRAVLVWGILYNGDVPRDTITFAGHEVTADVTSTVSGNLCWSDSSTIGYAADVTDYVNGNGTYDITDPPRGETRPDADPYGTLPFTDGATLVVFYNGGGAHNQVLSDFTYDTNTDDGTIHREFSGANPLGKAATLTVAGPDGQNNAGEGTVVSTSAGSLPFDDLFNGSDPQDAPSLTIGNLWDTDTIDVASILPAGVTDLNVDVDLSDDCVGIGAAVLQVEQ